MYVFINIACWTLAIVAMAWLFYKYRRLHRRLEENGTEKEPDRLQRVGHSVHEIENEMNIENDNDRLFKERLDVIIRQEMQSGKVEVGMLADKMCLSRSQLNRRTKKVTGMTTSVYSTHIRLQEACRLLREEPDTSIAVVAQRCGFDDPAYFARVFRRQTGATPSDYRKS